MPLCHKNNERERFFAFGIEHSPEKAYNIGMSKVAKKRIVNHFSSKGIIRCMPRETLYALLKPYEACFRTPISPEHAERPEEWQAWLRRIEDELMTMLLENEKAQELAEFLDDIDVLDKRYIMVSDALEDVYERHRMHLEGTSPLLGDRLSMLVSLRTCRIQEVQRAVNLIVSRAESLDSGTNKDYWWAEGLGKEPFTEPKGYLVSDLQQRAEAMINEGHRSHQFDAECRVSIYPKTDDDEIWCLIERGSRRVVKETMDEQGTTGTVRYSPLFRSCVVLDCRHGILRIRTGAQWMYTLFLRVFSEVFYGRPDAFAAGNRYTFRPIYSLGLSRAFSPAEFMGKTVRVQVTRMLLLSDVAPDYPKVELKVGRNGKLDTLWSDLMKRGIRYTILSVHLILTFGKEKKSIQVQLDAENGLRVSRSAYTGEVRRWLRRCGFEGEQYSYSLENTRLPSPEEEAAFWSTAAFIAARKDLCKSVIKRLGERSPGVAAYLCSRAVQSESSSEASLWYDENGKAWEVYYDRMRECYFTAGDDNILGRANQREIPPDEVERLTIDRAGIAGEICDLLMPANKKNMMGIKDNPALYKLGRSFRLRVDVYLHLPVNEEEMNWGKLPELASKKPGSIAVLSWLDEPPREYKEMVEQKDIIQFASLSELLRWNVEENDYEVISDLATYLSESEDRPTSDEIRCYTRWPYARPAEEEACYSNLTLRVTGSSIYMKWGKGQNSFKLQHLPMFCNGKVGQYKANASMELLRELIEEHTEAKGNFFVNKVTRSTLNTLSDAMNNFFGIDEKFYETCSRKGTRYLRLKFQACSVSSEVKEGEEEF